MIQGGEMARDVGEMIHNGRKMTHNGGEIIIIYNGGER